MSTDPQTDLFVPPAAEGLPLAALDSATEGADRLDAAALTPNGRNFLAHALVQLARDGWLRTEPGEGFEPVRDREATPEPEDPSASVPSAPVDRAAVLAEVIARVEAMQGYPRLVLPEEIVAELRRIVGEEQHEDDDTVHACPGRWGGPDCRCFDVDEEQQPETQTAAALPARLEAVLTERFTELGNQFAEMRVHEQGPDGWPSSRLVSPHMVAEALRELLAAGAPAAVAQSGKEATPDDGPPAPLRRSENDCPGFPEHCPNLLPVDPNPPQHLGGIRCGCADDHPADSGDEPSTEAPDPDHRHAAARQFLGKPIPEEEL